MMDVFTLDKEEFKNGKIVNDLTSVSWVERYNKDGECTLTAKPEHDLLTTLADGTLISHTDTEQIMMIESHSIVENEDTDDVVTFIGRTIDEIVMENRVVTLSDHASDAFDDDYSRYPMEFNLPLGNTWNHVETLLDRYTNDLTNNPEEYVPYLDIRNDIVGDEVPQQIRVIQKLSLLSIAVREMLSSVDAGLKIERPNNDHPVDAHFVIHNGEDKTDDVRFDWNFGELDSPRYVWSIKDSKNSAYVSSEFYTVRVFAPGKTGLDLRIMPVIADDWKKDDPDPDSTTISEIKSILGARGRDQISKHPDVLLLDTKISTKTRYKYNKDYRIGDLVSVAGNYGTNTILRVTEYAIIKDANGVTGLPTLSQF